MGYTPSYKRDEWGRKVETSASIRRNIAETFGFQYKRIVLMEASYMTIEVDGDSWTYCNNASFSVNGVGYWTDFAHIARNEAFDA